MALRDGSLRWLATRAEVIRDATGKPVRMVGSTNDVTERVELLVAERQSRASAEGARRCLELPAKQRAWAHRQIAKRLRVEVRQMPDSRCHSSAIVGGATGGQILCVRSAVTCERGVDCWSVLIGASDRRQIATESDEPNAPDVAHRSSAITTARFVQRRTSRSGGPKRRMQAARYLRRIPPR